MSVVSSMDSTAPEFQKISQAMTNAMEGALEATAVTNQVNSPVPPDPDKLFAYLKDGKYKNLAAKESAAHPSRGPHSKFGLPVRVFMDATIQASLAAGNREHPAGHSLVKEMYTADGQLDGWAVMPSSTKEARQGRSSPSSKIKVVSRPPSVRKTPSLSWGSAFR